MPKLNEPITLQLAKNIPNEMGGYKTEWQDFSRCFAAVESLFNKRQLGHEVALAKEVVSVNFYQFTLRYNSEYNTKMRVIWQNRTFEIVKVIDTNKRFMQLIAQETL